MAWGDRTSFHKSRLGGGHDIVVERDDDDDTIL